MDFNLDKSIKQIQSLCQQLSVERLYLFGSASKGTMDSDSDLDFIYSFKPALNFSDYTENYFKLREELSRLTSKKIDLVAEKSISNPYLQQEVEKSKVLLYAA